MLGTVNILFLYVFSSLVINNLLLISFYPSSLVFDLQLNFNSKSTFVEKSRLQENKERFGKRKTAERP
jgi:hypothetical protein